MPPSAAAGAARAGGQVARPRAPPARGRDGRESRRPRRPSDPGLSLGDCRPKKEPGRTAAPGDF